MRRPRRRRIVQRAKRKLLIGGVFGSVLALFMASPAMAQEELDPASQFVLDNLWIFIAGVLV